MIEALSLNLSGYTLTSLSTTEPEIAPEGDVLAVDGVEDIIKEGDVSESDLETEPEADEELPGVIRKLMSGGFRGVADVRLRIVHQAALAEAERNAENQAAEAGGETVGTSVTEAVGSSSESDALTEEQSQAVAEALESFSADVSAQIETFTAAEERSAEDLGGALEGAHESLAAALEQILAAETEAVDTVDADVTPLEDLLAGLQETFDEALLDLMAAIEEASAPEVSPARGNGQAYGNFLDAYNALSDGTGEETDRVAEAVDAIS